MGGEKAITEYSRVSLGSGLEQGWTSGSGPGSGSGPEPGSGSGPGSGSDVLALTLERSLNMLRVRVGTMLTLGNK